RRRPRRGRADPRRGAREVRRGAPPLPHARRGHGAGDRRGRDGRGGPRAARAGPPLDHRPSPDGRRGLSCRLPRMERLDSLVRAGQRQVDRRVARLDPIRLRRHRGALVARRPDRATDDPAMTRMIGRVGAPRPRLRPPSVQAGLAVLATTILTALATTIATAILATTIITPAAAHHVGAYVPKDNAVTTNFKHVKFAVQAKKFDVALQLFETGAL